MEIYFKPKQVVLLNETEKGIYNLIKNNVIWCEREYKAKDTQHVFLSPNDYITAQPIVKLAIVQASSLGNLFENDLIGCYKVCESFYKFFNKLEKEEEDETIDTKTK